MHIRFLFSVFLAFMAATPCRGATPVISAAGDRCIPSGLPIPSPTSPGPTGGVRATTDRVLYAWPLAWPLGHPHLRISDYVDEEPTNGILRDYTGGNYCYDGHHGTDINVNSFEDMDAGVPILAAANGVVAFVQDWDYDRELDGPWSAPGNGVVLFHEDGSTTLYWHMRTHSATVQAGEYVREGQILGFVGSAGTSTNPHLHFQITDPSVGLADPWGGAANPLPSRWKDQPPYVGNTPVEIKDLAVTTSSAFADVGGLDAWAGFKNRPSQPAVFGEDEPILKVWSLVSGITRSPFTVDVRRPDGSLFAHLDGIMPVRYYGQSFQYWDLGFSGSVSAADYGTWTVEAFRDGASLFKNTFLVGTTSRFAPRFYIAGRSFHLSSERQEDALSTSYLGAPAESLTFSLENAPADVSLRTDENGQAIVAIDPAGPDLANTRSREFAVVATDPDGRQGRMHYHLVNDAVSILGSPPVVSAPGGVSMMEGDSAVVKISASDPEGDAISDLSVDLQDLPIGSVTRFDIAADHRSGRFIWQTTIGDAGTYTVRFTAQTSLGGYYGPPAVQTATATTTIEVHPVLAARAFTSPDDRTIRLRSGKPYWCAHVLSVDGAFDPSQIPAEAVRLISAGTGDVDRITPVSQDKAGTGEATFCFEKEDVDHLFASIHGARSVTLTLVGSWAGIAFSAKLDANVVGPIYMLGGALGVPDLNDRGQVALSLSVSGVLHAAVWDKGRTTDLGFMARQPRINDKGQVGAITTCPGQDPPTSFQPVVWAKGSTAGPPGGACDANPLLVDFNEAEDLLWSISDHTLGGPRAFVWQGGAVHEILHPGTSYVVAIGMNDLGAVLAASIDLSVGRRGFVWENGVVTELPMTSPRLINNKGQVVGTTEDGRTVLWRDGVTSELQPLPDASLTSAMGLNDDGVICGLSGVPSDIHAVIWDAGSTQPHDLGHLPGDIVGYAISESPDGTVLGASIGGGRERGFVWRAGTMTDMGTLGGEFTVPIVMNNHDQIVGVSQLASGEVHPFFWDKGTMTDMNAPEPSHHASTAIALAGGPDPMLGITPNPSHGEVTFHLRVLPGETGSLDVFNLSGRRVRHIDLPAGGEATTRVVRWDGRGAGAGVYWARLTAGSRQWERRLVLLK